MRACVRVQRRKKKKKLPHFLRCICKVECRNHSQDKEGFEIHVSDHGKLSKGQRKNQRNRKVNVLKRNTSELLVYLGDIYTLVQLRGSCSPRRIRILLQFKRVELEYYQSLKGLQSQRRIRIPEKGMCVFFSSLPKTERDMQFLFFKSSKQVWIIFSLFVGISAFIRMEPSKIKS